MTREVDAAFAAADAVMKRRVDDVLLRSTVHDLLRVCGIEPAGVMTNEEDLVAVKRYVQGLQATVDELLAERTRAGDPRPEVKP